MDLLFSHRIDKIMLYSDYLENDVITSCIPTVKRAEKKFVSAVNVAASTLQGDSYTLFLVPLSGARAHCLQLLATPMVGYLERNHLFLNLRQSQP